MAAAQWKNWGTHWYMVINEHIEVYIHEFTDNKLSIKYIFLYDNLFLRDKQVHIIQMKKKHKNKI